MGFQLSSCQKKNGQIHLRVDFRALNKVSVKDNYPLPNMEVLLQQASDSQMVPLLDGFSRYNQVSRKKVGKHKITFTTKWGTYAYNHIAFGLVNVGDAFQRAMHTTFTGIIGIIIIVYLDDLTIFSKQRDNHFFHLIIVFLRC